MTTHKDKLRLVAPPTAKESEYRAENPWEGSNCSYRRRHFGPAPHKWGRQEAIRP